MTHFGAICNPSPSHLMLMISLGRELENRGHRFTLFGMPDNAEFAQTRGIRFQALDSRAYLPSAAILIDALGPRSQGGSMREILRMGTGEIAYYCEQAPQAMRDAGVEGLISDQAIVAGKTVAERLQIPVITMCAALPISTDPAIPPYFSSWRYSPGPWARTRNRFAHSVFRFFSTPFSRKLNGYRRQWGLPPQRRIDDTFSSLALISQLVREFDFPFREQQPNFYYVGPYQREDRQQQDFPYDRLDGRPLIFATLGTLLGSTPGIWKTIAESCAGLGAQLAISLGGKGRTEDYRDLPGQPLVVGYAPQRALLKRVSMMITHGGLNSAMEALAEGVPMVVLPAFSDQPGVAARVAASGAGEFVPLKGCRTEILQPLVKRVFGEPRYKQNASGIKEAIRKTRGLEEAADIIERFIPDAGIRASRDS